MKLTFINNYELAVVTGTSVINVDEVVRDLKIMPPQQIINRVIERWEHYQALLDARVARGHPVPLAGVKVQAPLPKPISIVCMAVNYMENGRLKEKPAPNAFFKHSHGVLGHGDTMHLQDTPATIFEGEAELALVIGKTAKNVRPEDADQHIFGYLNFVDGSARGFPLSMGMPYFMKGQDESAPLGPWITTKDEIKDPMNLHVQQWNNGHLTHDYYTSDMAHNIAASLAFVSAHTTLEAGDVIALGTNHQGLHPIQHGDLVEQEIDGLGRLSFSVADAFGRTWERFTRAEWGARGGKGHAPQLSGKYAKPV